MCFQKHLLYKTKLSKTTEEKKLERKKNTKNTLNLSRNSCEILGEKKNCVN